MSEYLVRWKFGAHSLLNPRPEDTHWYQRFYPNKEQALTHYVSLLHGSSASFPIKVELFELTKFVPGDYEIAKETMAIIGEQQPKGNTNEQEVGIHEAEAERQR